MVQTTIFLEPDSASAPCHLELGRLYARRGAVKDAVRHFTHHLALERDHVSGQAHVGEPEQVRERLAHLVHDAHGPVLVLLDRW